MIVEFDTRANHRIDELSDYIARDNPERAVSFAREIYAHCRSLAKYPERFSVVSQAHGLVVRKLTHGDYRILCVVHEERVVVIDVVHSARDLERALRR